MGGGGLRNNGMFGPGQRTRQRQVKAELLHHMGIAMERQQRALARRQAFGAVALRGTWVQGRRVA